VVQILRRHGLVTFRACCQNFAVPAQTLPDSWIIAACPVCKEKRRYFPAQIFRGQLSDGYDQGVPEAKLCLIPTAISRTSAAQSSILIEDVYAAPAQLIPRYRSIPSSNGFASSVLA